MESAFVLVRNVPSNFTDAQLTRIVSTVAPVLNCEKYPEEESAFLLSFAYDHEAALVCEQMRDFRAGYELLSFERFHFPQSYDYAGENEALMYESSQQQASFDALSAGELFQLMRQVKTCMDSDYQGTCEALQQNQSLVVRIVYAGLLMKVVDKEFMLKNLFKHRPELLDEKIRKQLEDETEAPNSAEQSKLDEASLNEILSLTDDQVMQLPEDTRQIVIGVRTEHFQKQMQTRQEQAAQAVAANAVAYQQNDNQYRAPLPPPTPPFFNAEYARGPEANYQQYQGNEYFETQDPQRYDYSDDGRRSGRREDLRDNRTYRFFKEDISSDAMGPPPPPGAIRTHRTDDRRGYRGGGRGRHRGRGRGGHRN